MRRSLPVSIRLASLFLILLASWLNAGTWNIEKGHFAETCVQSFLADAGWIKLETAIGPNGIDFLGVKLKNRKVTDAIAVEIKGYADAPLPRDTRGLIQGSNQYNANRIDRYIQLRLDPVISAGGDAAAQAKLEKQKYLQARTFFERDINRSRFIECEHKNGSLLITIYRISDAGVKSDPQALEFNLNHNSRIEQRLRQTVEEYCRALVARQDLPARQSALLDKELRDGKIDSFDTLLRKIEGVGKADAPRPKSSPGDQSRPGEKTQGLLR